MPVAKPFRVLSLDGGGMRGIYTLTYLAEVSAAFARRRGTGELDVGKAFDLIVGTSTGGIIGCGLAAGVPPLALAGLYREHGAEIFRRSLPTDVIGVGVDYLRRKEALRLGEAALRTALEEKLGKETLVEVYARRGVALAITAVEMSQHTAWVFKTPHFEGTNHRDDYYTLVDVCLASSAAPIYRSLAAVDHPNGGGGYNVFADGGLWANNPVLVGMIEALEIAELTQPIEIFCLGTCPMPAGEQIARNEVYRGLTDWKFGGEAASLSIDAQQFAFDHMARKLARHLPHPCRIVRFPSQKVPATLIPFLGLDDARPQAIEALVNQARHDASMTNSRCGYRAEDPEAELICGLFESAPALSSTTLPRPLARDVASNPTSPAKTGDR